MGRAYPTGLEPDRRRSGAGPLHAALSTVSAEAAWEVADLLARKDREMAGCLIQGRSAELAASPLVRERLVAMLLDRAAEALARGELPNSSTRLFEAVKPIDPARATAIETLAGTDRCREAAREIVGKDRREREAMAHDAVLNFHLWKDERLAADDEQRAVMLACARQLEQRARRRPARNWLARMLSPRN